MEGLQFLNEFFKGIFELEETYWAQPFHYSDEKKKKKMRYITFQCFVQSYTMDGWKRAFLTTSPRPLILGYKLWRKIPCTCDPFTLDISSGQKLGTGVGKPPQRQSYFDSFQHNLELLVNALKGMKSLCYKQDIQNHKCSQSGKRVTIWPALL